jgi:methylmalonyl-CoA/ethylmalonyl-CoA epimerase
MITRLDHVAVAVRDPEPAARLWGELLGGRYVQGDPDWHGFGFLQFEYPNGSRIEIISPGSDRDGFVLKFLDKRGEGMHHMTYITDDIRADVETFRDRGFRVVDEDYSWPHWQEAFLHPRTAHGVLIQLAQSDLTLAEQDELWGKHSLGHVLELAAQLS